MNPHLRFLPAVADLATEAADRLGRKDKFCPEDVLVNDDVYWAGLWNF